MSAVPALAATSEHQLAAQTARDEFGTATQPGPNVADTELIRHALDGKFHAFEGLVARYERQAFWIAFHVIGRVEDARDVVQEAFVRIYRNLDRFDLSRNFYTWIYRIVTNLAIDNRRRRIARPTLQMDEASANLVDEHADTAPDAQLQSKERAALVRAVLAEIPEMFRTVLTLRDLEGLSCREIAPITGLTYSTVRWRLHRARELFRQRWELIARQSAR